MSKYSTYGKKELITYINTKVEKSVPKQAFCEQLQNGQTASGVIYKNKKRYFNSKIDQVKAINEWSLQFTEDSFGMTYYLFGFANGDYVRKLMELTDSSNSILVFEPFKELFDVVIDNTDIGDILKDERVTVLVEGINSYCIVDYVNANTSYINKDHIRFYISPNYNVFEEKINSLRDILNYQLEHVDFTKITEEFLKDNLINNELLNLPVISSERVLNQLVKLLNEVNIKDVPAIIISAGPSLDKNINEITKAKGKSFVIAVDTALKAVLRAGIEPDLTVCVDPRKEIELFQLDGVKKIPAVYAINVPHSIVEDHTGPIFFCGQQYSYTDSLYKEYYGESAAELAAGGSVANSAFSLAVLLGFKTIILVGQDLAFTGGRGHTKDAYDDEEKNKNDLKNYNLVTVEDIEGNPITTDVRMKAYIKWFENQIIKMPEVKVIDATEGGAMIHGSKIMTLKKAIEQECRSYIDLKKIIKAAPPVFSEQQQADIKKNMLHINDQLDDLAYMLHKGIETYQKIIASSDKVGMLKDKTIYSVIETINSIDENSPLMNFVQIESTEDKYEVTDSIYSEKKDDVSDDIEAVSENAIKLLKAYIKSIDKLKARTNLLTDQLKTV